MPTEAPECKSALLEKQGYTANPVWLCAMVFMAACSFASSFLSISLIYKHLISYTNASVQRRVVSIILIVPVYSLLGLVAFLFVDRSVTFLIIRDAYEAVVIYQFFNLFLEYLGPSHEVRLEVLSRKPRHILAPPLCCLTFDPSSPGFLRYCRIGVLQFVLVRLCGAVLSLVLEFYGRFCHGSMDSRFGNFYITIANGLGMGLSMFTLVSFYICARHDISSYSPISQFMSVKFVIFFNFWINVLANFLISTKIIQDTDDWSQEQFVVWLTLVIIAVEMVAASVWHQYCFSAARFLQMSGDDPLRYPFAQACLDVLYPQDFIRDMKAIFAGQDYLPVEDDVHLE
ncbi:hypothetical protein HDV03_003679 [Kappamyces sp. JEL0829]|nr:hypothetical protein HDV03_003679 [Kappamyces sp. JEL0829]